jgi:hypothetical protein
LLEIEYLEISRHGGPSDPSSFENTERNVSVQTWRLPAVEQLDEKLEKFVPFGDVSAATDPTASNRLSGTARNAITTRRTRHLLSARRAACIDESAIEASVGPTIVLGCLASVARSRQETGRSRKWRRGRDSNPRCRLPHMAV